MPKQPNHGAYEFLNTLTGKRYIGATFDLNDRSNKHWSLLYRRKHYNAALQMDFDKYGREHFTFNILEYTNKIHLLCDLEQKYIDKYGLENLYNVRNAITKKNRSPPKNKFVKKNSPPKKNKFPNPYANKYPIPALSARRKRWNDDKDNNLRQFLEKHGPEDMWDAFIRVVQMDLDGRIIAVHGSAPKKVHVVCRQHGVDHKKRFRPRRVSKSFWAYEKFVLICNICKYKPEIDPDVFMCISCGYAETHILNSLHNLEKYKLTYA